MLKSDLLDLNNLSKCEFVRYTIKGEELSLLVVADNEEGQVTDYHNDEESCDCCEGLNGHLFLLVFSGVSNFNVDGQECDNYKTSKLDVGEHHLGMELAGINFFEGEDHLNFSFDFTSYVVKDRGEILGPSA